METNGDLVVKTLHKKITLDKSNAIRIEKTKYKTYVLKTYIFRCKNSDVCDKELRVQGGNLKLRTGYCMSCIAKKIRPFMFQKGQLRPFEARYNKLLKKATESGQIVKMSYKNFLKFTKIEKCHYCNTKINWKIKTAYNLDRMDSNLPYQLNNCVVCCGLCNFTKRDKFTYDEFLKIGVVIKNIRKERNK